jgi:DNA-binding PadR family transcriptional regulator
MTESAKSRGTFLALLALKDGPKHGYEIASHIEQRTGGFFKLSFGALYPILHKLEQEGLVEGAWEDIGAAKKRKVYSLTKKGHASLAEERERYEAFTGAFARLMKGEG